ncbi:nucleoid-associated protein YgaU [Arthrobacter sp. V4I6]|uniref:CIS tube protein n=1 Tax=unclassified Arthrobacter TaxID=235627 RepID=UPI0027801491|nr:MULTISPECIES: peptidase M23 [unclassified Arthrobacter]MDQ0821176.1 nucleoid-associated protein YgaU [Arthrobacter sp. V1I7]MDQ0855439.1 nucleoid-associated protein YgaU [Arthrobacter sp. V4I6]
MTTSAVAARASGAAGAAPAAGPAAAASSAGASSSPGGEGALKLSHAYLELYEPSKDGSLDKAGPQIGRIEFQFNPKELSMGKTASWTRQTAKANQKAGPPQYNGPMPSKLTLEMFFDASGKQDDAVVQRVDKLFACCVPTDASLKQNKGSPPWVLFRWGELTGFLAYVASVQVKYTLFTAAGLPVRATCTVTLEEIAGSPPKQNPTSGGLVPRRVHVLIEGDTLAGIAYNEYGNASLWRAVAAANRIDDPLRLRPGTSVLLPAVSELPSAALLGAPAGGREVLRGAR